MADNSQVGLSDIERAAIQILIERELTAAVRTINRDYRMSDYGRARYVPHVRPTKQLASLTNPFETTETTKVSMASPLQGIGQKLSKLKHDAEFEATKLAERVDAIAARKDAAIAKSNAALDGHEKDVADIEAFVTDLEKATNA